jgi:hypothetical protein
VTLSALGKAEQIVWLLTIVLCLQIFVSELADGHNHVGSATATARKELPLPTLNPRDRRLLSQFPGTTIAIATTDMSNAFVGICTITFVDAENLKSICHAVAPMTLGTMKTKLFLDFTTPNAMGVPELAGLSTMPGKATILGCFLVNGGCRWPQVRPCLATGLPPNTIPFVNQQNLWWPYGIATHSLFVDWPQ